MNILPLNNIPRKTGPAATTDAAGAQDFTIEFHVASDETVPDLPVIDEDLDIEEDESSYDPYDSGTFDSRKLKRGV